MIKTFIAEYNKNHNPQINVGMQVNAGPQTVIGQPQKINVNRISIQDHATNPSNKYIEELRWKNGNKMAVAIGLNPSQCPPNPMDKTNELLCYLFSLKYDGYFLMNLYSLKQTNNFHRRGVVNQTDAIRDSIVNFVNNNNLQSIDIFFFFGRSCYLTEDIKNNLANIARGINNATVNFYKIVSINFPDLHQHPSRLSPKTIGSKIIGKTLNIQEKFLK